MYVNGLCIKISKHGVISHVKVSSQRQDEEPFFMTAKEYIKQGHTPPIADLLVCPGVPGAPLKITTQAAHLNNNQKDFIMDDATAEKLKAKLDQALTKVDKGMGIKFGVNIYDAFLDRGWFKKDLILVSSKGILMDVESYNDTHAVLQSGDTPDNDFQFGVPDIYA